MDLQLSRELIRVDGEVDLANVTEFKLEAESALERKPAVLLIDFRGCDFIDSSVIAALVELQRSLNGARSTTLAVVARRQPRQVLRITALDEAMPVFEGMVEALEALDGAERTVPVPASSS
jgi:anti-anti-sigma factor